jgi:hypothetical protein
MPTPKKPTSKKLTPRKPTTKTPATPKLTLAEACDKFFNQLLGTGKAGLGECRPHEGDILVRVFSDHEFTKEDLVNRFEGYSVRVSEYQPGSFC